MSSADRGAAALTLRDAAAAVAARTLTARALADAQLQVIAATDAGIDAWATLDPAHVRAEADRADTTASRGALAGIGIGVKDIIQTRDHATQMGSAAFAGHRSERDAECVARLRAAGGYVFGKTVTTELAFMHPGKTRNPHSAEHSPGGSSSGSAAAVAALHVAGALGTQTNGSIVRPAAYCGVVGFKPTLGAIPYDAVNLFSETLDTLGTFTRSVADAALLAGALSEPGAIAFDPRREAPTIAFLPEFPWSPVDDATREALGRAVAVFEAAGAHVRRMDLPEAWRDTRSVLRTIMLFEAARNLRSLRAGSDDLLSATLRKALDDGASIASEAYRDALARRAQHVAALDGWMARADIVITPPAPSAAPRGLATTGDPSCCTLFSLLGAPALNLPIGRTANRLPLGLQIAARPRADTALLGAAEWCETQLEAARER